MSEIQDRLQQALAERYQVQRELGRGGMATVFLATDLKHEREVAIKVLHPELAATIGPERFDREIRIAAKLQHPNILGLFDSGEANGLLYYVMPFIFGESLRDRLNREHMLPVDVAVGIAIEVADALGYAHSLGIVHRDIKPENIMISGGHALVADFGIARAASGASGSAKLTETGMAVGTPLYMSPEQAVGEVVGPTADIYSLGCVLYEMLTGQPPFTGSNARQIMARHAMDAVPSIQVVRDTVPDQVEDAVMASLAKVVADRPQTAAQFIEMLGAPPGGTARYAVSRASRAMPRRSIAAITPDGAVTLTLKKRSLVGVSVAAVAGLLVVGGLLAWWILRPKEGTALTNGLNPHNIAVLYFTDESPKGTLGVLAEGLTENLISTLNSVKGLDVISTGGVAQYRDGKVGLDSIARALQTGTLVQGSVDEDQGDVRVTLKMLDETGVQLDRRTFKGSAKDVVALADSLATEAAVLIRRRLGEETQLTRSRAGTRSTDAWTLYQRAVQRRVKGDSTYKAGDTPGFLREYAAADSLAGEAYRFDNKWVAPLVLQGTLDYWRSRRATDDPGKANLAIDSGLARANRALALERNNADALELRGNLSYWRYLYRLSGDKAGEPIMASAREDLEKAAQLNPNSAWSLATLSHLYARSVDKNANDVIQAARTALERDAYLVSADQVLNRLVHAYYDTEQFGDSEKWCKEGQRRFPTDYRFIECQLLLMTSKWVAKPDPALAWKLADSVVKLTSDATDKRYERLYTRALVAGALARAGLKDSAQRVLRATKDDPEVDPARDLAFTAAFIWQLAGDTTEALNQIKSYLVAQPDQKAAFRESPNWWFRRLSEDPRYQALVR